MDDFNRNQDWLGRGWSFPPEFDRQSLAVNMVSADADIAQSLTILLNTSPGERVMNPAYGCGKCHQKGGTTAYVKQF